MGDVFDRLKDYLLKVAQVLRGEAEASSIFPNPSDIGTSRERVYARFLIDHLPSCCNTFYGGFLFNDYGIESKQLDIIVYNSLCPQYNFHNNDGTGKSFASIDGAIAVVSVKSTLTSAELENALDNIASVPDKKEYSRVQNPFIKFEGYEDWPYKIIYAKSGVSLETASATVASYYEKHPEIPIFKRANLIHVSGSYFGIRTRPGAVLNDGTVLPPNLFWFQKHNEPDVQALAHAMFAIQRIAITSQHLLYNYDEILGNIMDSCIKK